MNTFDIALLKRFSNANIVSVASDDVLLILDKSGNVVATIPFSLLITSLGSSFASLDGSGKIPASQLPSYVDDVLEFANLAAFPGTGETGKIYTALDTNKIYRWSGSTYIEISASPGSTDSVTEGISNLYFTAARVLAVVLSGLSTATNAVITASDSVLSALGKLQKQITDLTSTKAPLASPTFTGTPVAPTPAITNNSTQIATTAFISSVISALTNIVSQTTAPSVIAGTFTRSGNAWSISTGAVFSTNIPRFEPAKFGNGYLSEDATTNDLGATVSSAFDVASGWGNNYVTTTLNAIVSPDGTSNAATVFQTTATNYHSLYMQKTTAYADNSNLTEYFIVKALGNQRYIRIQGMKKDGATFPYGQFDLVAGTVYSVANGATAQIIPIGNSGYFRCAITFNIGVGSSVPVMSLYQLNGSLASNFTGVATDGVAVWRAQQELKVYPTSYTSGTRNLDSLTYPSAGILNSTAGTIAGWITVNTLCARYQGIFYAGISGTDRLLLTVNGSGYVTVFSMASNITGGSFLITPNVPTHIAITWFGTTMKLYVNGALLNTGTYAPFTVPTNFEIGTWQGANNLNGTVDDFLICNRVLSDAEIQNLFNLNSPAGWIYGATCYLPFDDSLSTLQGIGIDSSNNLIFGHGVEFARVTPAGAITATSFNSIIGFSATTPVATGTAAVGTSAAAARADHSHANGNTDTVAEGATNLYFTNARALSAAPAETVSTVGALINSAGASTTPADTDCVAIRDNASGFLAKVTWANVKATLKTYFDSLYSTIAGLSDYSDATWTPTFTFATPGNVAITYLTQVGTYIKKGKEATVNFTISTSTFTWSTASGELRIPLPFTARTLTGYNAYGSIRFNGITKPNYTNFVIEVGNGATYARVIASASAQSVGVVQASDMPSGGSIQLMGTIVYFLP